MRLCLIRHGEAEPASSQYPRDGDRPLTEKGRKDVERNSVTLKDSFDALDGIFSSPFTRARQTAEILREVFALKDDIVFTPVLAPGSPPHDLITFLEDLNPSGAFAFVAHQPDLGLYVDSLTRDPSDFAIPPGTIICLDMKSAGSRSARILRLLHP